MPCSRSSTRQRRSWCKTVISAPPSWCRRNRHDSSHRRVQGRHRKGRGQALPSPHAANGCPDAFRSGRVPQVGPRIRDISHAYGDVARRIGFDRYKVLFRIAQCHQEYGRQVRSEDSARADAEIAKALESYDQLLSQREDNALIPDVLFNAGFANQLLKKDSAAQPLYQRLVDEYADHPAAPNGLCSWPA